MTVRPGEFWIADIPFTDQSASKRRPILTLWLDGVDVVAAVVTSAAPRTATDVRLNNWHSSGLRVPSTVRLSRLDCLERSLLGYRLGDVSPIDAAQIKTVWNQYIRPQF